LYVTQLFLEAKKDWKKLEKEADYYEFRKYDGTKNPSQFR